MYLLLNSWLLKRHHFWSASKKRHSSFFHCESFLWQFFFDCKQILIVNEHHQMSRILIWASISCRSIDLSLQSNCFIIYLSVFLTNETRSICNDTRKLARLIIIVFVLTLKRCIYQQKTFKLFCQTDSARVIEKLYYRTSSLHTTSHTMTANARCLWFMWFMRFASYRKKITLSIHTKEIIKSR